VGGPIPILLPISLFCYLLSLLSLFLLSSLVFFGPLSLLLKWDPGCHFWKKILNPILLQVSLFGIIYHVTNQAHDDDGIFLIYYRNN